MGKFLNTQRKDYIDSLVIGFKERMKNPYYLYTESKPTITTYYTINEEKSTLDDGLQIVYSELGPDSPFRFNKIYDFYIYGLEKITTSLDMGDFGVESEAIEGEAIILPDTIVPSPGNYFSINYLDKTYLFKINSVNTDTLESGANFYKIGYKYESQSDILIQPLVVQEYTMIVDNVGTNFNPIIRNNDYNFVSEIDNVLIQLKRYYKNLFYNDRVQTFTYILEQVAAKVYDPYLIEFILRNKLLDGDGEFVYIQQQIHLEPMFGIQYDGSFFRNVELKNADSLTDKKYIDLSLINQPLSILSMRKESYFQTTHTSAPILNNINILDDVLYTNISNNVLIGNDIYDIIIKYFNNIDITGDDIVLISNLDYNSNKKLFYCIPIIIYILEHNIKNILRRK